MTEQEAEAQRAAMALLEEALELPSVEQQAFIENRTDIAEDVRRHALDLLRSDRGGSAGVNTGGAAEALGEFDMQPPDLPGYRILRQLGRGGMGAVWLARRDGADFEHQVAIKFIKPGVLAEALVERFRRERQILARLNHANIAHLYDGGETVDGQPYIVMEYIEGQTLREWLEDDEPSLERQLNLFRQIALAVEFAHQNLIIHRDLTPNNVLVTASEQAKLIDFGIARPQVVQQDNVELSRFSGLSLTPGFAAPERAGGVVSNTLTDIYSLGRILALLSDDRGEPELDAIAAKAAAEEPGNRYPSVSDLIEDVDRYRRKQPVGAFSNARSYRFGKFLVREWRLATAAATILLVLLGGLGATAWAYNRVERERVLAEQRFDQLRDLAHFQLFPLYDQMNSVVGNTAARIALAERAQAYLNELAENRTDDPQLQLDTALGFLRLALIQGIPAHPNFGEPEAARQNLDRAERLLQRLVEEQFTGGGTGLGKAHAYRALLFAHWDQDIKQARASIEKAEAVLGQVPERDRDWAWMQARRVARIAALETGDLELDNKMLSRYADLLEADIAEWPKEKRGGYEERFDRAVAENYRAVVLHNNGAPGPLREGVQRYLNADRIFAELEKDFRNDPLVLYRRAWNAYYGYAAAANAGQQETAERLLNEAHVSVERLLEIEEADHSLVTFAERAKEAQAEFLSNSGRHREAIELQEAIVAGRVAKIRADRRTGSVSDAAYGKAMLGSFYRKASDRAGACRNWAEAEEMMAELEKRGALIEAVGFLRPGIQTNLARCRAGEPVTAFTVLYQP